MRHRLASVLLLGIALVSPSAQAGLWPTVPDDIARSLADEDVVARRSAASRLRELPSSVAAPLVAIALEDSDTDVRLHAARAATELGIEGVAERVLGWLSEADPRLRLAACDIVRSLPTPRAVAPLSRVLGDANADVRLAAATTLGIIGDPEAVPSLLGHLDDPSPEARTAVVIALGRIGDPRAVVPLLGKAQDTSPDVRRMTVRVLGDLGDGRASSALLLSLRDKVPAVRVEAIESLGRLRSQEAVAALSPLATDRSSLPVRNAAVSALARVGSPAALDALMAALETDDSGALRSPVRQAIARFGVEAVPRLVASVRTSGDPAVVAGACLVLAELHAPNGAAVVIDAMQRGQVPTRVGLRALAVLGDASALPFVLELLEEPSAPTRRGALEAARAMLDPAQADGRAVDPIAARLRDAKLPGEERVALTELLGRTAAPRAAALLMELAKSKDRALSLAAIGALGSVGQAGQDRLLMELLDDTDPEVRLRAAMALSRVAAPGTAAELLDRLERASEQDRASIGIALSGAMANTRDDAVARRASALLSAVRESTRDVLVEGLGRMPTPSAGSALASAASTSVSADDRRKLAEALAGHPAQVAALRKLATDTDPSVQANAVWSLGHVGDASDAALLRSLARHRDVAVAGNAIAAYARLVVAGKLGDMTPLCSVLGDPRAYVRANVLSSLALVRKRCAEGAPERAMLLADSSPVVRSAAADALRAAPAGDGAADRRTLRRCAMDDRSGAVAARCRQADAVAPAADKVTEPVLVFVVPDGATNPVSRAPFALVLSDGLMRMGLADRRGALFEIRAPRGEVALAVPATLVR